MLMALGFGGSSVGNLYGPIAEADGAMAIETALDAGIGYFDTARLYGNGIGEHRMRGYSAAARVLPVPNGASASVRPAFAASVSGRTGLRQGPTGRPERFVACFTAAL